MVSAGEQCFKAGQQLVNFPLREVSHWVSHWVSQFHMGFTRFKSCLTLFNQLNPSIRETESDRVGQSRTESDRPQDGATKGEGEHWEHWPSG